VFKDDNGHQWLGQVIEKSEHSGRPGLVNKSLSILKPQKPRNEFTGRGKGGESAESCGKVKIRPSSSPFFALYSTARSCPG